MKREPDITKPAAGRTSDWEFLVEEEAAEQRREWSGIEGRPIRLYPIQGALGVFSSAVFGIGFTCAILASPRFVSDPVISIIAIVIVIAFALGCGLYTFNNLYRCEITLTPEAIEWNTPFSPRRIAFADVDRLALHNPYGGQGHKCMIYSGKQRISIFPTAAEYPSIVAYIRAHISSAAIEAGLDTSKETKKENAARNIMCGIMLVIFIASRSFHNQSDQSAEQSASTSHPGPGVYYMVGTLVIIVAGMVYSVWMLRMKRP